MRHAHERITTLFRVFVLLDFQESDEIEAGRRGADFQESDEIEAGRRGANGRAGYPPRSRDLWHRRWKL
jgi:hypothetical protein